MHTAHTPRAPAARCLAPIVSVVLAMACGSAPPAPAASAVELTPVVAPAPAPASPEQVADRATPEQATAAQEGQSCETRATPRERALCYLQSDSEASIEPLFAIGRSLAALAVTHPTTYWKDFIYVAEDAGVLAARSGDARLYAGLRSADPNDQLFAVHALRHMLATLRFGYARGKDDDAKVRGERLEAAHSACAGKLGARDEEMVKAAADCLEEIRDPRDGAGLIDVLVSHPSVAVQLHLVGVAAAAPPIPGASLKKLVPVLERKLLPEWTHDELTLRAEICQLLLQEVPPGDPWPKKPARAAVHEIGNRNSQARAPCEELADRKR